MNPYKTKMIMTDHIILCHQCKHGALPGYFRCCHCPDLGNAEDYTDQERDLEMVRAANANAKMKGIPDFNAVAYLVPMVALEKQECKHYMPVNAPKTPL